MRLTARETTRAHPSPTKHHSPGHQPRKEPTPDLNRLMLKFRKHVMKEGKTSSKRVLFPPFGHENNEKNVGTVLGATWAPETTLAGALSRKAPSSGFRHSYFSAENPHFRRPDGTLIRLQLDSPSTLLACWNINQFPGLALHEPFGAHASAYLSLCEGF